MSIGILVWNYAVSAAPAIRDQTRSKDAQHHCVAFQEQQKASCDTGRKYIKILVQRDVFGIFNNHSGGAHSIVIVDQAAMAFVSNACI